MKKFILLPFIIIISVISSCTLNQDELEDPDTKYKDSVLPMLSTASSFQDRLTSTPKSGGTIIKDGGFPILKRGIVWSKTKTPTLANNKTEDGVGIGSFVSKMINLEINTTYYVRAYATNEKGTSYGEERSITTINFNIDASPAMMTAKIANVQYDSMQPSLYSVNGNDVVVLNTSAPVQEPRHLNIQGVTSEVVANAIKIDLYIPNIKWTTGTYPISKLEGLTNQTFCQANIVLPSSMTPVAEVTGGSIIITEFNMITRRIKGTFTISYKQTDGNTTTNLEVTNGTFTYGLDDAYFQ